MSICTTMTFMVYAFLTMYFVTYVVHAVQVSIHQTRRLLLGMPRIRTANYDIHTNT